MPLDRETPHFRRLGRAIRIGLATSILSLGGPASASELPLDVQEKLLREQAVEAVKHGNAAELFDAMDEYRAAARKGVTIPSGLLFAEADAARLSGDPVRVERAFNDFFQAANAEGEAFAEAMRVYGEFRRSIPESLWPILEAMAPIPGGVVRTSDRNREVRVAPFSLSRRAVTHGEFEAFLAATDIRAGAQEDVTACRGTGPEPAEAVTEPAAGDPVACVSWGEASAYAAWLSESSGLKFRLPRAAEWEYVLQEAGLRTEGPDGPAGSAPGPFQMQDLAEDRLEWVQDCAVASDAARDAEASCARRMIIRSDPPGEASRPRLDRRTSRGVDDRTSLLGFRLAVGP